MAKLLRTLLHCSAYRNYICVALLCLLYKPAKAQNVCRDSSQINPYTNCGFTYQPVCGCDGQTYKNACEATSRNGIVQYGNGPCEPIAINFNPNPVIDFMDLTVIRKEEGGAQIVIYDIYGKVYYEQYFSRIQSINYKIDTQNLPHGIYILVAYTSTYGTWRKFVKQARP